MSVFARLKLPLLTALAMLVMVVLRVLFGAVVELRAGEQAMREGDFDQAIVHLERSLHWYLPVSPTSGQAIEGLWSIGRQAEALGTRERALEAYQALRGGIFATRSFYTPHRAWLELANERIAALQVTEPDGMWPDPSLTDTERKAIALEVLERQDVPDPGWSFLAIVGFLGWVGSALGFLLRGFEATGRFNGRAGLRWGAGFVMGYALWVIGLMRA